MEFTVAGLRLGVAAVVLAVFSQPGLAGLGGAVRRRCCPDDLAASIMRRPSSGSAARSTSVTAGPGTATSITPAPATASAAEAACARSPGLAVLMSVTGRDRCWVKNTGLPPARAAAGAPARPLHCPGPAGDRMLAGRNLRGSPPLLVS
jgi:hypothetical protein